MTPIDSREHVGAAIVGSISRRLPCRRWQAAYWLGKLLSPQKPFVGRFNSGRIEVHPDDFASMQAFYLGFFEREVTMLCIEEIRRNTPALVVDVGANFGYYPLLFGLLTNGKTRVIAFEPDPSNAARLERNVAMNPGLNITVVPMAVGDRTEAAVAFGAARHGEKVWSRMKEVVGGGNHGWCPINVPMISLDAYLDGAGVERVPLTLIDVEGYEGKVIEGMARGLAAHRYQKIMIEFHPWAFASPTEIEQIATGIAKAGYRGFRIRHHPAQNPDKTPSYYDTRFDDAVLEPMTFESLTSWEHFWFEVDDPVV